MWYMLRVKMLIAVLLCALLTVGCAKSSQQPVAAETLPAARQTEYKTTQVVRDTFVLIQLLADIGCKYSTKISDCNYYVAADEELLQTEIDIHTRYYAAAFGESGERVTLLTWDDFLEMLDVTEKDLCKMDMPTINPNEKRKGNTIYYSSGEVTSTLGDQLKAKGIDLLALLK